MPGGGTDQYHMQSTDHLRPKPEVKRECLPFIRREKAPLAAIVVNLYRWTWLPFLQPQPLQRTRGNFQGREAALVRCCRAAPMLADQLDLAVVKVV